MIQQPPRATRTDTLFPYTTLFRSESGEILNLSNNGLSNLFEADIPTSDKGNISNKINSAILKFRRHKSTLDDRREAIRDLAEVLEFIRPAIKDRKSVV